MKINKPGLALLVALVSVFGVSQTASAAPCVAEIDALKDALNDGYCSYAKRKRCRGLNNKLDNVSRKLEKGRMRKAARKLANFGNVVEHLTNRKRKRARMAVVDYQALMNPYFNNAAVCISNNMYVRDDDDDDDDQVASGDSGTSTGDTGTTTEPEIVPEIPTGIVF